MADGGDRLTGSRERLHEGDRIGSVRSLSGLATPPGSTRPSKSSGFASATARSASKVSALVDVTVHRLHVGLLRGDQHRSPPAFSMCSHGLGQLDLLHAHVRDEEGNALRFESTAHGVLLPPAGAQYDALPESMIGAASRLPVQRSPTQRTYPRGVRSNARGDQLTAAAPLAQVGRVPPQQPQVGSEAAGPGRPDACSWRPAPPRCARSTPPGHRARDEIDVLVHGRSRQPPRST